MIVNQQTVLFPKIAGTYVTSGCKNSGTKQKTFKILMIDVNYHGWFNH